MNLTIDNLDGSGPRDYSAEVDTLRLPKIVRRLNRVSEMELSLVSDDPTFVVPVNGARVMLGRSNGSDVFTGYITEAPVFEYLGWGERGPIYRYNLSAQSDEILLDRKRLPNRSPFVSRSAGDALRQLAEDVLPGGLDTSGVDDLNVLPWYACDPQKKWSEHAREIGVRARAAYRCMGGALTFASVGEAVIDLDENDPSFCPKGLSLERLEGIVNDVTLIGLVEPNAYVHDYFVGDGYTTRFYLSQTPFARQTRTIFEEEYDGTSLDGTRWSEIDPQNVVRVSGGKLQVAGGTGVDGKTCVTFVEKIELGGALVLQHGNVVFSAASDGVLGGLYANAISVAGCMAGFRITPSGTQSNIQALVNGAASGAVITTVATHQYALATRLYATEIYRMQQGYHSVESPAGEELGGSNVASDVRVVLEVHDIDPNDPASYIAASTVLFDGVISGAPGFCSYAIVNSKNLHCTLAFTRLQQAADVEVRSALPGQSYRTRLAGSLVDGAECAVTSDPALQFYSAYVPAANELITVHYRDGARAVARVTDQASIAAHQHGSDDGVRAVAQGMKAPAARTSVDCENGAVAWLQNSGGGWSGSYENWSDFLPQEVFPGDAIQISAASRGAAFTAVVREVSIQVKDMAGEHSLYQIQFADDFATPLAAEFESVGSTEFFEETTVDVTQVGKEYIADLTAAEVTQVTSTTATIAVNATPPSGGGIEVRRTDFGWGPDNDRNLIGRFTASTLTLPRLSRTQDYFLRQYDGGNPPKYSRHTTGLHIDYPL